ncbi:transposase [Cryobacterium sp. Hh7]|uniref:tyrosine-type recombinase/integrase n=1 Tax=Cryobacterium sp. Hh7 TaxID=1259159 RepID=UPI00106AD313|nr:tyrosine-type recombinase/integrase [Cryobacterium sp. Hh7]TFD54153.1 transposase [Cryobacterium sp. Hh7]
MSAAEPANALRAVPAVGTVLEDRYAADVWHAAELGVPAARGRDSVSFTSIQQPWLRQAVKRWARQRLVTGHAFNTVRAGVLALKRFSNFLAECAPSLPQPQHIDRPLLERYLAWLQPLPLAASTKSLSRVFLRALLEENRRYGWVPAVPATAVIYPDELSSRRHSLPRFIPEFVMSQLENVSNLAQLAARYRNLVVVITETGLRANDACTLAFDTVVTDSAGGPCLRFMAAKMRAEHLLPLSPRAAEAIRSQQHDVARSHPAGSAWLFTSRFAPNLPVPYDTLRRAFTLWQQRIGLHDEAGRTIHVTLHQFRHSLGTRLINAGVPQHVIQRLLTHASPEMTAVYAHMHDSTLRAEFERYCQTRVDVEGRRLGFDPTAVTANAEWVKHRLAQTNDTLPNGYCGRPPQQDCPHPNACLTCPDFQTTADFLPVHRQQADLTRELLTTAEASGWQRQADNHRKVLISLDTIIASLEALRPKDGEHA